MNLTDKQIEAIVLIGAFLTGGIAAYIIHFILKI